MFGIYVFPLIRRRIFLPLTSFAGTPARGFLRKCHLVAYVRRLYPQVLWKGRKNLYLVKRKISMQVSPPVNPPACSSAHHYKPSCVRVQGLHATDFFHRKETKYTTDARKKTASFVSVMHLKQLQYHQPHVVSGKKKTNIPSIIVFVLCGSTFESRREQTPPRDSEVAPADKTISDCWICSADWRRKRGKERRKKKLATAADLQTPSSAPWVGFRGWQGDDGGRR